MPERLAFEMARRAASREARLVGWELRRGVDGLGTVASTATWWGLALTCWHLIGFFRDCRCNAYSNLAAALLPVAGRSSAGHSYFLARAEELASEAHCAWRDIRSW